MRAIATVAVSVLAGLMLVAQAQPKAALLGVHLGSCNDVPVKPCSMSLSRVLPSALETYHQMTEKPEPWVSPYVPLSTSEIAAMHELRDALLMRSDILAPDKFKNLRLNIYSSSKSHETFNEARQILAAHKCKVEKDVSVTRSEDNIERYGVLMFICEEGGAPIRETVTVAMREARVVRAYLNYTVKIYADLPSKAP